jgi:hypothetical protein
MSTLSARWFGFLLLLIAGTAGCAQSETGAPASPTSPSSLSAGPSATAVGPSAGYDASGTWCIANTDAKGNLEGDPFETIITQDPATGDLSLTDEDGMAVRLARLSNGQGAIITYRLSFIGNEGGECDFRAKGTLLLDTTTNTVTGNLRLKELGCSNERVGAGVIGRKASCPAQ